MLLQLLGDQAVADLVEQVRFGPPAGLEVLVVVGGLGERLLLLLGERFGGLGVCDGDAEIVGFGAQPRRLDEAGERLLGDLGVDLRALLAKRFGGGDLLLGGAELLGLRGDALGAAANWSR